MFCYSYTRVLHFQVLVTCSRFPATLYGKNSVQVNIQVNILGEKIYLVCCYLNKITLRKTLGLISHLNTLSHHLNSQF